MGIPAYPATLLAAQWERQKGVLEKPTGIGDALKALKKAHEGVDADWLDTAALADAAALAARRDLLKGAARAALKKLTDQSAALKTLATKWEGEFKKLPAVAKTAAPASAAVAKAASELAADMTKALDASLADVEARHAKAAAAAAAASKAGAKGEPPPEFRQVRSKVLESLRTVRADQPGAPPVLFMICLGAKGCAVYMAKSVSASHKTLLQALLPGDSGFKYYEGQCVWEKKTHTFVGENIPTGIGKRLQEALLHLTKARIKVRVRRQDGTVEEVDGDADLDALAQAAEADGGTQAAASGLQAPAVQGADPAKALQARAAQVAAGIAEAVAGGQTMATGLKAKLAEALAQAKGPEGVAAAAKAVETIAKALAALAAQKPSGASPPQAEAAWTKARDAWRAAIEAVDGQIASVRDKMLASGSADLRRIADRGLPALTDNHKTPVMRALFEVDGSRGDARRAAVQRGRDAVAKFQQHIQSDPMVQALDANAKAAFGVELTIRKLVGAGLGALDGALAQLAAG